MDTIKDKYISFFYFYFLLQKFLIFKRGQETKWGKKKKDKNKESSQNEVYFSSSPLIFLLLLPPQAGQPWKLHETACFFFCQRNINDRKRVLLFEKMNCILSWSCGLHNKRSTIGWLFNFTKSLKCH